MLLASGGLFLMSVIRAATADPGFRLDGGVIVQVDPALAGYDKVRGRQAHLALIDRLRNLPGLEAVTIGSRPPFSSTRVDSRDVAARGRTVGWVALRRGQGTVSRRTVAASARLQRRRPRLRASSRTSHDRRPRFHGSRADVRLRGAVAIIDDVLAEVVAWRERTRPADPVP